MAIRFYSLLVFGIMLNDKYFYSLLNSCLQSINSDDGDAEEWLMELEFKAATMDFKRTHLMFDLFSYN